MKLTALVAMSATVVALGLTNVAAHAADVRVLSAVGMRQVLQELAPQFERSTGHRLMFTFDAFGVIMKRIEAGETADVIVIPRAGLERLVKSGAIVSDSAFDIASSIAGVAIRKGAPKPDISSPEAFKRMLLDARAIARPDPTKGGSSGVHIAKVLERLGIAAAVEPKSVIASNPENSRAMPGYAVADGAADVALHQMQELMAVPGIEVVGPFPAELQETFVFSAGVMTVAKPADAGRVLVDFLRTEPSRAVIRAKGMHPAAP